MQCGRKQRGAELERLLRASLSPQSPVSHSWRHVRNDVKSRRKLAASSNSWVLVCEGCGLASREEESSRESPMFTGMQVAEASLSRPYLYHVMPLGCSERSAGVSVQVLEKTSLKKRIGPWYTMTCKISNFGNSYFAKSPRQTALQSSAVKYPLLELRPRCLWSKATG